MGFCSASCCFDQAAVSGRIVHIVADPGVVHIDKSGLVRIAVHDELRLRVRRQSEELRNQFTPEEDRMSTAAVEARNREWRMLSGEQRANGGGLHVRMIDQSEQDAFGRG